MRRSIRTNTVPFYLQEKFLRRQLLLAIVFLVAMVGICAWHFKTYDPSYKQASDPLKLELEKVQARFDELQDENKRLKYELHVKNKKIRKYEEQEALRLPSNAPEEAAVAKTESK